MPLELSLLGLRTALIGLLFLFLLLVLVAVWRDLGRPRRRPEEAACLVVVDAGPSNLVPGQVIELGPSNSLGRSADCAVVLEDDFVSAQHALLAYRRGRWRLRDLGSTNGTFLNQAEVRTEVAAPLGSLIQIGRVKLRLEAV